MLGVMGDLVEDVVVWLSESIRRGTDSQVEIFHTRGGSAANVASFASQLHPTRFIGCVGPDHVGDFLVEDLASAGVDVKVQRRGKTGTIVVLVDDSGERTMLPHRGASTLLRDVPDAWVDELELLHVPAYSFDGDDLRDAVCDVIGRAHTRGTAVSVDASSTGMLAHFGISRFLDILAELGPRFLLTNEDEAKLLDLPTGGAARDRHCRLTNTTVVVKAGAAPTTVYVPGKAPLTVPVSPILDVRDSTGAGDAFAAGFLSTFLRSGELERSCLGGHRMAAAVLDSPGAFIAAPEIPT